MIDHAQHGSLEMLRPLPAEYASAEGVEILYRILEQLYPSEFQKFGSPSAKPFRNVCRIACINFDIPGPKLGQNLREERALPLTQAALGPFCPPQEIIRKDTFRAIGIALSLSTGVLITPCRAFGCFHRPGNQRFQQTEYGRVLLKSCGVDSWPPPPPPPTPSNELQLADFAVDETYMAESLDSIQHLSTSDDSDSTRDGQSCLPWTPEEFAEICVPDRDELPAFFAETDETLDETMDEQHRSPGEDPSLGLEQLIRNNQRAQIS